MIRGSNGWALLGWIISFTTLSSTSVLLRFWSARIQKREFYADDGYIILAYITMLAQQGLGIWGLINGQGNESTELSMSELLVQAKVLVSVSTTWIISTAAIKLAVLALYMRIFSTPVFKKWAISLMVFSGCFGITFLVVFLARCSPVSQEWDPKPWGWCRPLLPSEVSSISFNLVLDTAIVALPMPWLWSLNMATRTKIIAMIMFSFGFATIAIMCYRLDQTVKGDPDPLVAMARIGLLSNMELWLGIIVACIPTMAPFAKTYIEPSLSKIFSKLYGSSGGSSEETPQRVKLKTFGSSGASGSRGHINNHYSVLDEPAANSALDHDEMRLIGNRAPQAQLRTAIGHGKPEQTLTKDGIHVQKQFQTFEDV